MSRHVPQVKRLHASYGRPSWLLYTHRTGGGNCSKYCTLCSQAGHRQKRGPCLFRGCGKCNAKKLSPQDGLSHVTIAHDSEQTTLKHGHSCGDADASLQTFHLRRAKAEHDVWPPFRGGMLSVALTPAAAHAPTRTAALHSQLRKKLTIVLIVVQVFRGGRERRGSNNHKRESRDCEQR